MNALKKPRKAAALLMVLGITGCTTVGTSYEAPKLDLPTSSARPLTIDRQWWKAFGDPVLDQLISDALLNNYDLAKAAANIKEARANAGSAAALLSPRVDGIVQAGISKNQFTTAVASDDFGKTSSQMAAGLGVQWDADLWGQIQQMNDAALARLSSSEHTRNAIALSVSAAVAETYFQLRAFDTKLTITRDAIRNLKEVSNLEMRRWKAEVGTELAYRQSLAELSATEARLPALDVAVAKTEFALQLLVGLSPMQMSKRPLRGGVLTVPDTPREFDTTLLLRRPDVASAEQLLIATHADVNAAHAAFYPRLNLGLLVGFLASTSNVISGIPLFFDATAGLTAPIYDAGLNQSKLDAAEARKEKALVHYRYTVTLAFRDTYEAMVLRDATDRQVVSSKYEVATRKKSLTLTEKSYEVGRSSKYEVLSEAIKVLNAEIALADAQQTQLVARSQFYKAVGGGF